ncbi:hypothetical protein D9M68_1000330 [compost metagenome]
MPQVAIELAGFLAAAEITYTYSVIRRSICNIRAYRRKALHKVNLHRLSLFAVRTTIDLDAIAFRNV